MITLEKPDLHPVYCECGAQIGWTSAQSTTAGEFTRMDGTVRVDICSSARGMYERHEVCDSCAIYIPWTADLRVGAWN